jgi:predicted transcriptional regulator of viral defense system
MILKKDLMALKKDITVVGKKVENLLKEFEKDKKGKAPKASKAKAVKTKTAKKAPAKPAKKAPAKKKTVKVTATDQVLKIVNSSKKGVDNPTLMKKTGFDERKVRNIIFRAYREGKIQRAGRGLYSGVETTAPKASDERAVKAKPSVKEPEKMVTTKLTDTDQVLKLINASKKGLNIITIKEKTGFEDKKVRNIIFRTNKEGKIQRADRGIYIGVK